jgi:hypothetical protein
MSENNSIHQPGFGFSKDLENIGKGYGCCWCAIRRGKWGYWLLPTVAKTKRECHSKLKEYVESCWSNECLRKMNLEIENMNRSVRRKDRPKISKAKRPALKEFEECWVGFVSLWARDTVEREIKL